MRKSFVIFFVFVFFPLRIVIASDDLSAPSKEIVFTLEDAQRTVPESEMENWFIEQPFLSRQKNTRAAIENIDFCQTELLICRLTQTWPIKFSVIKRSLLITDEQRIKDYLEELEPEFRREPKNATFAFNDGRVIATSESQDGLELNIEKNLKKIKESIGKNQAGKISIELETNKIPPKITSASINTLGIKSLIGEGASNFRGSPVNRTKNIQVAAKKFNGLIIKPGEEFSFIENLGPVDAENGYYPELVIKNNKTEPEFGGGICQVSTTVFRAAVYSGLKITARRNHAYPVGYYNPQGMDATVYIPKPDLKFVNNTPGNILVQSVIDGTRLIFQFYGANDERKVEVGGPFITERNPDGSMRAFFTQKVTGADGNILINDTFKSFYDSPSKFPHPGEEKITSKPKNWSKSQWNEYKKANGMN